MNALILSLALCVPLQTTWFVDDDADCTIANGSHRRPFCTLQDALDASSPGDRVLLFPGSYSGSSAHHPLNIEAVTPGSVTIGHLNLRGGSIRGLEITGNVSAPDSDLSLEWCDVGSVLGNGTLTADHCRFQSIDWWHRITLERCLVTYELRAAPNGPDWPSTVTELRHCTINRIKHLDGGGLLYSSIVYDLKNFPDWGEYGGWYLGFDSCVRSYYQLSPTRCLTGINPQLDLDWKPMKHSPCIDASNEPGGVDGDLDGAAVWDMGCFEYQHPRAYGQ
ncbi:MAG: hypothetical protein RL885_23235 [Planctomycetota bacterium]